MRKRRQGLDFAGARPRRRRGGTGRVLRAGLVLCFVLALLVAFERAWPWTGTGGVPMSYDTLSAMSPSLTEEAFARHDTDGDGYLDAAERAAAQAAGAFEFEAEQSVASPAQG